MQTAFFRQLIRWDRCTAAAAHPGWRRRTEMGERQSSGVPLDNAGQSDSTMHRRSCACVSGSKRDCDTIRRYGLTVFALILASHSCLLNYCSLPPRSQLFDRYTACCSPLPLQSPHD